jgi:hypothetical protein
MTAENVTTFFALILIFGTGITIPVSVAWFDHRTRTKALDVLRVYAERGEEPPPSVTQALSSVSGWPRGFNLPERDRAPDGKDNRDRIGRPRTRGGFLAHAAANTIFAAGFSGIAWWRYSELGQTSAGVIVATIVALFFAASVAAQLVGAYYAPDR